MRDLAAKMLRLREGKLRGSHPRNRALRREGKFRGGHLKHGAHGAEGKKAIANLRSIVINAECRAVEGRREQLPLSSDQACRSGKAVVRAHPKRDMARIRGEVARILLRDASRAR